MADETYAAAELASKLRNEPGEHVSPYAGLVDNRRDLELLQRLDRHLSVPVEETAAGKEILSRAATQTIDESVRAGNVSQMKAATGMTNQSENKERFFVEIADRLSHEGAVGLVFGNPGSGKTSLMLDAARVWRAVTGGQIIANVEWDGADGQFSSDTEMLELMASVEGPVLALLDEIAQELSGFGTGSKKAEAFSDSLLFIRKRERKHGEYAKRGSVMAVAHTRTKTAKEIRRVASFAVEKPKKTRPDIARILESEGGRDEWDEHDSYQGLTDTAETYDEYEASQFAVSETYDNDDESDNSTGRGASDSDIRRALHLHLNDGWKQERAGKAVGYSAGWVSNKVQAYRNGELNVNLDSEEN